MVDGHRSTVAGNLGGIAAAKFATIVAGSTNYCK